MIVRNESAIICRCLEKVKDIVDYISICDTGSTDNTVDKILAWGKKHKIPTHVHAYRLLTEDETWKQTLIQKGACVRDHQLCFPKLDYLGVEIKESLEMDETGRKTRYFHYKDRKARRDEMIKEFPSLILEDLGIEGTLETEWFRDFGYNRSNSVKRAQEAFPDADYILLLDADMKLVITPEFSKENLTADSHTVIQGSVSFTYPNVRFLNAKREWTCVGRTHEYYQVKSGKNVVLPFPAISIDDVGDGGCKQDKLERDEELLTLDISENPNNPRPYFYRANTRRGLGTTLKQDSYYHLAIADYEKRKTMGAYQDEVWYSEYQIGFCYECLKDYPRATYHYLTAFEQDPDRLEALADLAKMYRLQQMYKSAYAVAQLGMLRVSSEAPRGKLFLDESAHIKAGRFAEEMALTAFYNNRIHEGLDACDVIVFSKDPRTPGRHHILNNVYKFYTTKVTGKLLSKIKGEPYKKRTIFPLCKEYLVVKKMDNYVLLELEVDGKKWYRLYDSGAGLFGPLMELPERAVIFDLRKEGIVFSHNKHLHVIGIMSRQEFLKGGSGATVENKDQKMEANLTPEEQWDYFWESLYVTGNASEATLAIADVLEKAWPDRPEWRFIKLWYGRMKGDYDSIKKIIREDDPPQGKLYQPFLTEMSIVAYYIGQRDKGSLWSDLVLNHPETSNSTRMMVYRNLPFYCDPLPVVHRISLDSSLRKEGFHPCNPSGFWDQETGRYIACLRTVDYKQEHAVIWYYNDGKAHTENILLYLNLDRSIEKQYPIVDKTDAPRFNNRPIYGLEDIRLFKFRDELWAVYTDVESHTNGLPGMGLLQISPEGEVKQKHLLRGPEPNRVEKNWMPFVKDDSIYCIYSLNPFIVYRLDHETGQVIPFTREDPEEAWARLELRGSGAPVYVPGKGYLVVSHEVAYFEYKGKAGGRKYLHRFLWINDDLTNIVKVSRPFILKGHGVEMVLAMSYHDDLVSMFCGIEDREALILEVSLDTVDKLFS